MENKFMQELQKWGNLTTTENGAVAVKSTLDSVVDLFGTIGSMREYTYQGRAKVNKELLPMFSKAMQENKELAMKTLFYARDCRGGMGEKEIFRYVMLALLDLETEESYLLFKNNMVNIVEFGSWKDLLDIFDRTNVARAKIDIVGYIYDTIQMDIKLMNEGKTPSLLAKWLPTVNSKSKHTKRKAKNLLTLMPKLDFDYRHYCSNARKMLKVVERNIAQQTFSEINYSAVPSRCMLLNRNLFMEKDHKHFKEYLDSLEKGETKINSSVLFPSDITGKYYDKNTSYYGFNPDVDTVLEEQWKALPNYMDRPLNAICVVDTSGSMQGTPMNVATALGIYIAERNPSESFRNKCLEFSHTVKFIDFSKANTLRDKLGCYNYEVANTNLEKVFDVILDLALYNKLEQKDLPTHLILLSDMQFDQATEHYDAFDKKFKTLMEKVRDKYSKNGYNVPQIIYWNINVRTPNFPEIKKDGVCYVSGYSPAIMKAILNTELLTPIDVVKNAVMIDRYKDVYFG